VAQTDQITLVLDTDITPELRAEGWARDTVRHVQQFRKELDLNIEDRIHLRCATGSGALEDALQEWRDYIMGETLAVTMQHGLGEGPSKEVDIGRAELTIQVEKA
jgi:isoleucyl-tRNA synthetase